jgi:hypothetical protein
MRRARPLVLAALCALGGHGAALAGDPAPRLSAEPGTVRFGEALVITGTGWPTAPGCRRRVRLSLESDQNAVAIGPAAVRANGRFTRRFTPRRRRVGAGRWRVAATLRCDDRRVRVVRRAVPVRIG